MNKTLRLLPAVLLLAVASACSEQATDPVPVAEPEATAPAQEARVLVDRGNRVTSPSYSEANGPQLAHTPFIRIAGVGASYGYRTADVIVASGDVHGSVDRISEWTFNAMSPADLRAAYDVLIFTWASHPGLNGDWATRIQPYMALGGGVIWEDDSNFWGGDLNAIATPTWSGCSYAGYLPVSTPIPGLTDGLSPSYDNHHFCIGSWAPWLTPYLVDGWYGAVGGVAGQAPTGGRITIHGPDHDYHGWNPNNYLALKNAILWVANPVIPVMVDIHPGSTENPINLKAKGVTPVAVLSDGAFDATTIDASTVKFGPGGATEAHGTGHVEDVDGDGDMDMMFHFDTQATGLVCGATSAELTGKTTGNQAIKGSDTLKTNGCK